MSACILERPAAPDFLPYVGVEKVGVVLGVLGIEPCS
jgi:hypothetical protein